MREAEYRGKRREGSVLAVEGPWDPVTTLRGQGRLLVPSGPIGGLKCGWGRPAPPTAHGAALGSICSRFLGSQKNCSFRGSSFTSTGIASYSSLSMLKEPPVPCGQEEMGAASSRATYLEPGMLLLLEIAQFCHPLFFWGGVASITSESVLRNGSCHTFQDLTNNVRGPPQPSP